MPSKSKILTPPLPTGKMSRLLVHLSTLAEAMFYLWSSSKANWQSTTFWFFLLLVVCMVQYI